MRVAYNKSSPRLRRIEMSILLIFQNLRRKIVSDLQLEKERIKLQRRSEIVNAGFDCGDKQCFLEHHFVQTCAIYLPTNNTECQIPCKLKGCKHEIHHFISCPMWMCLPHTTISPQTSTESTTTTTTTPRTTTTATTTTPRTTTSTTPRTTSTSTTPITLSTLKSTSSTSSSSSTGTPFPPSSNYEILGYSSVVLNICLIFVLVWLLRKVFCKTEQTPEQQIRNRVELNPIIRQRPPNTDHLFTLDSEDEGESTPLLRPSAPIECASNVARSPSLAFSGRSTTGWSWCNITITPPISASRQRNQNEFEQEISIAQRNFLHMKTFKPVDVRNRIDERHTQETTV
jgi:hypothetical protein